MKLQIAFDISDLKQCLSIAQQVEAYADRFQIGSPLLYAHGVEAIKAFRKQFPSKELLAETQIIDYPKDITNLALDAGADWITVMARVKQPFIHTVCTAAHKQKKNVMLDLLHTNDPGKAAMNAETLGIDTLLFHTSNKDQSLVEFDQLEIIRGNSKLPIYIASAINRSNIKKILTLKPNGIVISKAIIEAENPAEEAKFFYELCKK